MQTVLWACEHNSWRQRGVANANPKTTNLFNLLQHYHGGVFSKIHSVVCDILLTVQINTHIIALRHLAAGDDTSRCWCVKETSALIKIEMLQLFRQKFHRGRTALSYLGFLLNWSYCVWPPLNTNLSQTKKVFLSTRISAHKVLMRKTITV